MTMFLLLLGLVLFVLLVVGHELGHFYAARRGGVDVEEFGLGFPPRIWSKRLKSKMLFTVNLLPLGGFVRLKGESDSDTAKGSYGAASLGRKVKIMLAGVAANTVIALVLLAVLAVIGMPKLFDNQFSVDSDTKTVKKELLVAYVQPGSPAERAGIETQDVLLEIGPHGSNYSEQISDADKLPELTEKYAGEQVDVNVSRDGKRQKLTVGLRSSAEVNNSKNEDQQKGYLGITPSVYELRRSTWSAPIVAVGTAGQFTWMTLQGLGSAIASLVTGNAGQAASGVSGPVGIFVILRQGTLLGYQFVLMIIAIISLTLAIMNVLPIPALDGGRLFLTLVYKAMKKPLSKKTEELVHGIGFMALMLLFVLITVVDVRRFF